MPSRFTPIQPSTSPSLQAAVINKNFAELDQENVTKILYDSSGVPSIIMGVLPDGTTGIVVAKDGVNVLDVFD